ncbi:uncharacterized protein LOC101212716 isoform X2 [Cucumis sativus]|uniref:Coenzyme Q-binding protein COQ10 START domain-containing protein n=1 Tax=Cucumis sativus TaxID=3659 RepID=A0A0A0KSD5_CUCSA|nr:uncharacterized protein LOC101212716 isoform X2 [Cucumis sativus]KGN52483.1 hypothetical protein Csa_009143 [Cucumis sativus]
MTMLCSNTKPMCLHYFQRESSLKKQKVKNWKCFAIDPRSQKIIHHNNLLSVSFVSFSDLPLYESPGKASFDEYLEDKPRLVKATFPGKNQQLNQEEWRIETPKIQLLFLKICPTIDMKIISKTNGGEAYPCHVPHYIPKLLHFQMTNWEINGIHKEYRPSSANVCSHGVIYRQKIGTRSRLKFQLVIDLSFLVPDALHFVPNDVLRGIIETVMKAMVEDLKHKTVHKLVEDYSKFRMEKEKENIGKVNTSK